MKQLIPFLLIGALHAGRNHTKTLPLKTTEYKDGITITHYFNIDDDGNRVWRCSEQRKGDWKRMTYPNYSQDFYIDNFRQEIIEGQKQYFVNTREQLS